MFNLNICSASSGISTGITLFLIRFPSSTITAKILSSSTCDSWMNLILFLLITGDDIIDA